MGAQLGGINQAVLVDWEFGDAEAVQAAHGFTGGEHCGVLGDLRDDVVAAVLPGERGSADGESVAV